MKNFDYIFFDLDGTLTDPKAGITKSVAYSLSSFGIAVNSLDELCKFIGPPLKESFMKYYSFSDAEAQLAVEKYREYFSVTGIFENLLYDGVPELLESLKSSGRTLAIASSKPTPFVERILEHFGISQYFSLVVGSELDGSRVDKAEVIAYALNALKIKDLHSVAMIGDREHDIIGAKKNGLFSCGVLYGYGNRKEFEAAGADLIFESVTDIGKFFRV